MPKNKLLASLFFCDTIYLYSMREVFMKKLIVIILVTILFVVGGVFFYLYQYTEVIEKKIIPVRIENISIKYVPGLSLEDANIINAAKEDSEIIKINELELNKEEINNISKYLKKLQKKEKNKKKNNKKLYELTINKTILDINEKDGLVTRNKKKTPVKINQEFYSYLESLLSNKNKELVKQYSFKEISFYCNKSTINVKNNLELFKDEFVFYPIQLDDNYETYNNGYKVSITVDQKINIYLYDNNIAYIIDKSGENEEKYYAVCVNRLYNIVNDIYTKSTSDE